MTPIIVSYQLLRRTPPSWVVLFKGHRLVSVSLIWILELERTKTGQNGNNIKTESSFHSFAQIAPFGHRGDQWSADLILSTSTPCHLNFLQPACSQRDEIHSEN